MTGPRASGTRAASDRPRVVIVQRKSVIGEKESARGTLRALGLGRTGMRVHHEDTAQLRGMLRKVAHLVEVTHEEESR